MPFICDFSADLLKELYTQSDILTGIYGRLRERWSYGMTSRVLGKKLTESDAILTELPVNRDGNNGRVDFMFTYRRQLYIMECKIGFVNFRSKIDGTTGVLKPWTNGNNGSFDQLLKIKNNNDAVRQIRQTFNCYGVSQRPMPKVIKWLPMVILGHEIRSKNVDKLKSDIGKISDKNFLDRHEEINILYRKNCCTFSTYKDNFNYINQRLRGDGYRAIIGYSFFAGHSELKDTKY